MASLKIRQEIGDDYGIAYASYCIAGIYNDNGNFEEALKLNFSALKFFQEFIHTDKRVVNSNDAHGHWKEL